MGTYDELMRLDKAKKVQKPKPKMPSYSKGMASMPKRTSPLDHDSRESIVHAPPLSHEVVAKNGRSKDERTKEIKRDGDTVIPRHHATMQPRYHDAMIASIRMDVKVFGKEAATHRFTPEEKKAIADIVYAYRRLGIKTNENEITRVGVNFLIRDYQENGENSVLAKALKALKA